MKKGDRVVIRDTMEEAIIEGVSTHDKDKIVVNGIWMNTKDVTWIPNKIDQAYLDMIPDEELD